MLTTENIQQLKKEWYDFEEINSIIKGLEEADKGDFLSEKDFWIQVHSEVNNNIKQAQWIL